MAPFTFESKIKEDGSLVVPKEVAAALGLRNGDTLQVQIESAPLRDARAD